MPVAAERNERPRRTGDRTVSVGVLGAGAAVQVIHLPILAERDDVILRGIVDPDVSKGEAVGQRFGLPAYEHDRALIDDPEVDALFVFPPNHRHEDLAVEALEAGKHVFVDRPLALTEAGVRRILDTADRNGLAVGIELNHRFRPDVSALRAFLKGGGIGEVRSVAGSWLRRPLRHTGGRQSVWRQSGEEAGGGALVELGVPLLDLCMGMAGYPKVDRVSAVLQSEEAEVEHSGSLLLRTESGITISLEVSWSHFDQEDRHSVRVMGTEGTGMLPPLRMFRTLGGRPMDSTPRQPDADDEENQYMSAYQRQLDHFLRAVGGMAEVHLPDEQVQVIRVIQAAYRSAREGREVEVG